jgi:hypothetical protein
MTRNSILTMVCKDGGQEPLAITAVTQNGGVSCSNDSFVVNQTLVFQIKFCGKSPALRVAAFQD